MGERRCRYCQEIFQPSKFQPRQAVCSGAGCQRKRRTDYHRKKIATDPEYREVCRDSPRKWRAANPGYWPEVIAASAVFFDGGPDPVRCFADAR
jgi:hypothetical protein